MNKNDQQISNLEEYLDHDPTDQLPTLTEFAFADEAEPNDTAEPADVPTLLQAQALATNLPGKERRKADRRQAARERETSINRLEKNLIDHQYLIGTLQEELDTVEQDNKELRSDSSALNAELEESITKLTDSEDSLAALRAEFAHFENELSTVESAESHAAAPEGFSDNIRQKDAKIADLEEHISHLQTELDRRIHQANSLTEAVTAGNDVVKDVTEQLYTAQEQLDELTDKHRRVDELTRELDAEHARSDNASAALEETRQRLEDASARAEQTASDLREQATSAEERLTLLENTRKEELQQLEKSRAEVTSIATQRDRLVDELQERDTSLAKLHGRIDELESERTQAIEALTAQRQIIKNMQDELRVKLNAITALAEDFNTRRTSKSAIQGIDLSASRTADGGTGTDPQEPTRMIIALDGDDTLKYPIHRDTMTIGRSSDNDIRIRRQFISRHHAKIQTDADGAVIEDLGSKNGVMVNSVRVERHRLRDGDLVDLGEMKFRFVDLMNSDQPHSA